MASYLWALNDCAPLSDAEVHRWVQPDPLIIELSASLSPKLLVISTIGTTLFTGLQSNVTLSLPVPS